MFLFRYSIMLLLFLSTAVNPVAVAQNTDVVSTKLDSLYRAYESATQDSIRVYRLIEIIKIVCLSNRDTAIVLCKKALKIAVEGNLAGETASCYGALGYQVRQRGENQFALECFQHAVKIREKILRDKTADGITMLNDFQISLFKKQLATSFNNIGFIYNDQGDIAKGLEYLHLGLKLREEIGDKKDVAVSLNIIGMVYKNQGDFDKGLEYYYKSLKIREEVGDKRGVALSLNNIGVIFKKQGDLHKAIDYYHKSLEMHEEMGYKKGVAYSLHNIGHIYLRQGRLSQDSVLSLASCERALDFFQKSLKIKEEIGDKKGIAGSLYIIGDFYFENGDFDIAKRYAQKCMSVAEETGFPKPIRNAARLSSKIHKVEGNYQGALEMYELYIKMRDSIKNEKTLKAAIRQQTKYEFEKAMLLKEQKQKEAASLEAEIRSRRDNLQYSIVLIGLLVICVLVAMLGRLSLPERVAEGIIFFAFLIFFEFLLVLADPYIDNWSGGAPGFKLLFNAGIAACIFPLHAFFETKLKGRLVK